MKDVFGVEFQFRGMTLHSNAHVPYQLYKISPLKYLIVPIELLYLSPSGLVSRSNEFPFGKILLYRKDDFSSGKDVNLVPTVFQCIIHAITIQLWLIKGICELWPLFLVFTIFD